MTQPNRRKNDLVAAESAYRKGLRRRVSDRAERTSYYALLALMIGLYVFLGFIAW